MIVYDIRVSYVCVGSQFTDLQRTRITPKEIEQENKGHKLLGEEILLINNRRQYKKINSKF